MRNLLRVFLPPIIQSKRKLTFTKSVLYVHSQAVCALRSLSITGGIQNLIICVKMAWSEHLDRGVNIR